jgi:hypothetical protein
MRAESAIRTLIALASMAVVLGAAACGRPSTAASSVQPSPAPDQTSPAPAAPSACAELDGTVGDDQICRVDSVTPDYTLDFRFPNDYPDQQAVANVLTQRRDGFIEWAAEGLPGSSAYALHIIGHPYCSGTTESSTQSLVFDIGTDGGIHPRTSYETFNYDLGKGTPITFDTLFKAGTQPVEVLDPIVQRAMDERWPDTAGAAQTNTLGAKMYQNFAITDDAVIFYIGQGQWLPDAAGPVEVSVPRTEIEAVLA